MSITRLDYVDEDTTRLTEPSGGVLEYTFNAQWLATEVRRISSDGVARSLGRREWDRDGMLVAQIDTEGNDTRYAYDRAGNLTTIVDACRNITRIDYKDNLPVLITDALGHAIVRHYDEQRRLVKGIDALGNETLYRYDSAGRLAESTDAHGGKRTLEYDAAGRLASVTDCTGSNTRYAYDRLHRLVSKVDALGNETAYTYDALGRLAKTVFPDGSAEFLDFDSENNLLTHTDARGRTTRYAYNSENQPIQRIDAKGQLLNYVYDTSLRLTQLVNENGEPYSFSYDAEGQRVSETGFDGKTTLYHYDRGGHLVATECRGQRVEYARDAMGHLLAMSTADGVVRYAYDAVGQLTALSSPHVEQRFKYDPRGDLIDERVVYRINDPLLPDSAGTDVAFMTTHAYDALRNRVQTVLPNGRAVDTLRYGAGHWHGSLWQGKTVADLERDKLHREVGRHLGGSASGLVASKGYDERSRLTSLRVERGYERLHERSYTYDSVGNLMAIADGRRGLTTYGYDLVDHITSAIQPGLTETSAFDPAGNMLDPRDVENADRSIANVGELIAQPLPGDETPRLPKVTHNLLTRYLGRTYSYDIHGNMVSRREQSVPSENDAADLSCAYDAENRLVRAVRHLGDRKVVALYTYDGFGRRIAKQVYTELAGMGDQPPPRVVTTYFVWDDNELLQEIKADAEITYLYEPGSFVPMARVQSSRVTESIDDPRLMLQDVQAWMLPAMPSDAVAHVAAFRSHLGAKREEQLVAARNARRLSAAVSAANDFITHYVCDHLGTPLDLVDEAGATVWSGRYRTWGGLQSTMTALVDQPLRFPGQYEDEETGLHYNRFRYYDSGTGRFLSQDPIGLAGGANNYLYAPNPTAWTDPLGLARGIGGAYLFETKTTNEAYVGKGQYDRFLKSVGIRTKGRGRDDISRGVWTDTSSPCPSVVDEGEYGEMVEHEAWVEYARRAGAKPLINERGRRSPGKDMLDPTSKKGKNNTAKCPQVFAKAKADGAKLVDALFPRPIGSGVSPK